MNCAEIWRSELPNSRVVLRRFALMLSLLILAVECSCTTNTAPRVEALSTMDRFERAMGNACSDGMSGAVFSRTVGRAPDYVNQFPDAILWSYRIKTCTTNTIVEQLSPAVFSNEIRSVTCRLYIKLTPQGILKSWFWEKEMSEEDFMLIHPVIFDYEQLIFRAVK